MAVGIYANRVLMNVQKDPEFDLEEYSFGVSCYPIPDLDYRLVISKRLEEKEKKTYYVVSTKANENDMFPKPVPDFAAVSWEDELESRVVPSAKWQLGDTGASLWETYEEAAEMHRRIAYRMTQDKRDAEVRGLLRRTRKVSCRSCGAEADNTQNEHTGVMMGVRVRPYALTDSGLCRAHHE